MKAIILAGGLGTRLQPYTTFLPKPMLPLGDKPLLEHLILWIKRNGIKNIILCVSYMHKTIQDYFEDGTRLGANIEYAVANRPLSTAGQLKTAQEFVNDTFVCMYGDSIYDFKLRNMIKQHKKNNAFITMSLYEYKTRLSYGVIDTKKNGKVVSWNEKPQIITNINMGCYVMEPSLFQYIPKNKPYGMDIVIKKALAKKRLVDSYLTKKGFIDIGDKTSYKKAHQQFLDKLGEI
jgi:mannose-1-phosphate guanylyltransferase